MIHAAKARRYRPAVVRYPVMRSAWVNRSLVIGACLMPAPVWLGWAYLVWQGQGGWLWLSWFALACLSTLCCVGAWAQYKRAEQGYLAWDGAAWFWLDTRLQQQAVVLETVWDGQNFLLLRCRPQGGRWRWVWLERSFAPQFWGDVRRALHFSRFESSGR